MRNLLLITGLAILALMFLASFTSPAPTPMPEMAQAPHLCSPVLPWFNKTFRGMRVPFNAVIERHGRHFWAWRKGPYNCLMSMTDI